jgi:hypothetical protein
MSWGNRNMKQERTGEKSEGKGSKGSKGSNGIVKFK